MSETREAAYRLVPTPECDCTTPAPMKKPEMVAPWVLSRGWDYCERGGGCAHPIDRTNEGS